MAAALRSWQSDPSAMYVVGSCCGPHPYPLMVRTFASIIGRIAKKQMKDLTGRLPSTVFAVCGGGSNLSAISYPYYKEKKVKIFAQIFLGVGGGGGPRRGARGGGGSASREAVPSTLYHPFGANF